MLTIPKVTQIAGITLKNKDFISVVSSISGETVQFERDILC